MKKTKLQEAVRELREVYYDAIAARIQHTNKSYAEIGASWVAPSKRSSWLGRFGDWVAIASSPPTLAMTPKAEAIMNDDERFIELRLPLRGLPYVALLVAACPRYGFRTYLRRFQGRCGAEGGRQCGGVHHLPNEDHIYEIDQSQDGRRLRWYAATLKGSPKLHRIRKFGAKLVATKRMSVRQVIETFPEPTRRMTTDGEADPCLSV